MDLPRRKPTRLSGYDYSIPGAYFITICTHERRCILSEIVVGDGVLDVPQVKLSDHGRIVEETLREIAEHYTWLTIDNYVIMPNHIHLLLSITEAGTSRTPSPTDKTDSLWKIPASNASLPMLISTFKRFTNRKCSSQLWQRSYHDHIISGENDYREIWNYIESNPARWSEDCFYQAL